MNVDPTINIGHIITIVMILFAGTGFYWRQLYDGRASKSDIHDIKVDVKLLSEAVSNQKLIEHRILQLEKWWDASVALRQSARTD